MQVQYWWCQFHEINFTKFFVKSISLKNQILAPSVYFQANEPKSRNLLIPPSGWMTTRTWLITDSQLCGSTGKWRISWGPNFVGPGIFFVKKGIFVEMLILNTRHLYYVHVWSLIKNKAKTIKNKMFYFFVSYTYFWQKLNNLLTDQRFYRIWLVLLKII